MAGKIKGEEEKEISVCDRRRVRKLSNKVRVKTRDNCDRNRKNSRVTLFARLSTDSVLICC